TIDRAAAVTAGKGNASNLAGRRNLAEPMDVKGKVEMRKCAGARIVLDQFAQGRLPVAAHEGKILERKRDNAAAGGAWFAHIEDSGLGIEIDQRLKDDPLAQRKSGNVVDQLV